MSQSGKPPVWQMVHEAIDALGGKTTNVAVRDWILNRYPGTNRNTIQCQTIVCTVNHASRVHYPENLKPRRTDTQYDFLFRTGRGQLEFYAPAKHGSWEIYELEDGRFGVRQVETEVPPGDPGDGADGGRTFAAEAHLRDYLARHLEQVEPGLQLYVDEDGINGVEYPTAIGRIDILAIDKQDGFVVIELKVSRGPDAVAGQVLRYKNWVRKHLADCQRVRGIIIAQHVSEKVLYAIAGDRDITAIEYEISLSLRPVEGATIP